MASAHIALVGCGYWGQNLARVLSELGVLGAVVDLNAISSSRLSLAYSVPARTYKNVLEDATITAIAIATPSQCHEEMVIQALHSQKDVFVEKPLALSTSGSSRIGVAVSKSGKTLMVGHVFQYHPAFIKLRTLVRDGELGQIKQIYSTRLGLGRPSKEDVFWTLGPHDVSMILSLVGHPPVKVSAEGGSLMGLGALDRSSSRIVFPTGAEAHIHVSRLHPEKERKLIVVGDHGMAVFDDEQAWPQKLVIHRHGTPTDETGIGMGRRVRYAVLLDEVEPLKVECQEFLSCIMSGSTALTDVQEGHAVVHVLESIAQALHQGKTTDVSRTPPMAIDTGPVCLVDLRAQKSMIQKSLDERLSRVLNDTKFIMSDEVQELEDALAAYTGSLNVVSCANGTDALTLALMALRVGRGDAVLVPALTFVATIEPVALLGAQPIIIDVDPLTLTLDPAQIDAGVELARATGHRPVALIAVDLHGHPANYSTINEKASSHGLVVIADAAQSFGATVDGRRVGTLAKITTTSFFPSKPLGCYGDGGALFTDDESLAQTLRSLRHHGRGQNKFEAVRVGMNSRLDSIQAAVLLCKLEIFPRELEERQRVARRYGQLLGDTKGTPRVRQGVISAWASYTLRTKERDILAQTLEQEGISTAVYYPRPLNLLAAYRHYPVVEGRCPVAESAAAQVLGIPMHPYLSQATQQRICELILFVKGSSR